MKLTMMFLNGFQSLPHRGEVALPGLTRVYLIGGETPEVEGVTELHPLRAALRLPAEQGLSAFSTDEALLALDRHNGNVVRLGSMSPQSSPIHILEPVRYAGFGTIPSEDLAVLSSVGTYPSRTRIAFSQSLPGTEVSIPCELLVDFDKSQKRAEIRFRQNRLTTHLTLSEAGFSTTEYVLEVEPPEIRDFIKASLSHYANAMALKRRRSIDLDWLYTAANLVYHQQFLPVTDAAVNLALPDQAKKQRLTMTKPASGGALPKTVLFVPSAAKGRPEPVRLSLRSDGSVEITLHPDAPGLHPLRHNLLMLGAALMRPPHFHPHFLDVMGMGLIL